MDKYYVYENANRRFKVGEFGFSFEVVEQIAGNWRGVLKTTSDAEDAALQTFAASVGITEITLDEYNALLKKKGNSWTPSPESVQRLSIPMRGSAEAVVVRDPSVPTILNPNSKDKLLSVDDAIVLGEAPYVDPLDAVRPSRKHSKKVKAA